MEQSCRCLATALGVSAGVGSGSISRLKPRLRDSLLGVAAIILSLSGGSCAVPEPTFSMAICAACIGGIVTLGGTSISGAL